MRDMGRQVRDGNEPQEGRREGRMEAQGPPLPVLRDEADGRRLGQTELPDMRSPVLRCQAGEQVRPMEEDWYDRIPDGLGEAERMAVAVSMGRIAQRLMDERRQGLLLDHRGRAVLVDGERVVHGAACCGYRIYGFLYGNGRVCAMRVDEIEEFDGEDCQMMIEVGRAGI